VPLPEVSGTLAVGNGGTGLYHLLLVVLLRGNVGALSVASAADIVAAMGQRLLQTQLMQLMLQIQLTWCYKRRGYCYSGIFYLG
jgi:hypothetical protein